MLNTDLPLPILVAEPITGYASGSKAQGLVEVLVDCPGIQALYTYNVPAQFSVGVGDILSVPLGGQVVGGIAIQFVERLPKNLAIDKIRDIDDVVASGLFRPEYWQWLMQIAEYYYTPLIQVIKVALPPGLLTRSHRRIRAVDRPIDVDEIANDIAKRILTLLQSQVDRNYSWQYIQQQIPGARRGLRELLDRKLIESYLESGQTQKAKLQKFVILTSDLIASDLTDKQREVVATLKQYGGELWQKDLLELSKTSSSVLKKIEEKGYLAIVNKERLRSDREFGVFQQEPAKLLTADQATALATIDRLEGFAQILLHGVTGSGKTEVYLQAIQRILASGKSALVLVPEIGLTPQLTDRFRSRFGDKVAVYHSALSDGERYDTWRQMLTATSQIVIGTRSAIFAPLPNLGLIILDEEHDSSFKQDQPAPTYHARDIAAWRAELESCPLILGSATPSLESWMSVGGIENISGTDKLEEHSTSHYLSLPTRVHSRPLPPVEIVDMRQELQQGNRRIFSRSLERALQQMQARQQQGILFIHRRGHSTFVSCRSCGYVPECPHCDVSLAYHQPSTAAGSLLRCHYCNHCQPQPPRCPECDSPYFKYFGSGTQKIVEELNLQFPQLRCLRFDSDTTSTKGAHRRILTEFVNGNADLLVGTQMLTKGLDLPQVTLVGVVAADGLLHLSDYRAAERAFQTLTQVAGRCGRGDEAGKVIVQTYNPEHPILHAVTKHDYHAFIAAELPERQMLDYPPYGKLILLRFSSLDATVVEQTVTDIAQILNDAAIAGKYELLGPAPALVMRVNNRYRWQIMLKYLPDGSARLPDWDVLRNMCSNVVKMTIDVDPQNFL